MQARFNPRRRLMYVVVFIRWIYLESAVSMRWICSVGQQDLSLWARFVSNGRLLLFAMRPNSLATTLRQTASPGAAG